MSSGAIECYPQFRRKLEQDNGLGERSYIYIRVRQLCVRRVGIRNRSGGVGGVCHICNPFRREYVRPDQIGAR